MPFTTKPSDSSTSFSSNPKLTPCKACGAQIAKKAKTCPVCGAKNARPVYKTWWFWVIIILIVGAAGGSRTQNASVSGTSGGASAASSSSEDNPSSAPEEPTNIFFPGDDLETKGLKITYQECDSNWQGYHPYLAPQTGNKIVRAYFIFENIGNSDQFCSFAEFDCYADGVSSSRFLLSSDDQLSTANLSPGRKLQGYVCFEVPADAEEIEIEYETSFWTQDKVIFVIE